MRFLGKVDIFGNLLFLRTLALIFCCVLFVLVRQNKPAVFASATENLFSNGSQDSTEKPNKALQKPIKEIPFDRDKEEFLKGVGQELEEKDWRHEINSYLLYIFPSNAKAKNGKVKIIESGLEYNYEFKLFGQLPLTFSLENEYININKTVDLELPSKLVGLSAGLEAILPFFNLEKTYLNLGVNPSFYADSYSFRTSAFRLPSEIFLIYKPKEQLTFIAGVAVCPDFKNSVLPVAGCIYKPNDKWLLEMTSDASNVTYSLNDRVSLFLEASNPIGSEFEVTRSGRNGVVLEYNEMLAGAGIKYKANKFIQASLLLGGAFNRYIKYRDEDGKVSIDNGLYTEFRVDIEI
jgi:hypothetical protein